MRGIYDRPRKKIFDDDVNAEDKVTRKKMSWTMMSPECQRCQTPREGAAPPSSKHHTRQVGPVVIQLIHKTTATVMTMTISLT